MLSAQKTSTAVTEDGLASRNLLNSSDHHCPKNMKPVDDMHVFSAVEYCKVLETRKAPQEIHLRDKLCCYYPLQGKAYEEWKRPHLLQYTTASL